MKRNHRFRDVYDAGFDAGFNGANTRNSHFSFFSSPERTRAWEQGKAKGNKARAKKDAKA